MLDAEILSLGWWRNTLRSAALVAASAALAGALAYAVGGALLLALALALVAGAAAAAPSISPALVLRWQRARPLSPAEAPELHALLRALARRAGLSRTPSLHLLPTLRPHAFTVGRRDEAAVAVSRGLLRLLGLEEVAGVLAHEVSHVRNHDLEVMALVDLTGRITGALAALGQTLLFLCLPLALVGAFPFSPLAALLMLAAPTLFTLLGLALSRTREFQADLEAARLLGDPAPLASALERLGAPSRSVWSVLVGPVPRAPGWLETHPATGERIRRLRALRAAPAYRYSRAFVGQKAAQAGAPPHRSHLKAWSACTSTSI